jgi:glycosyltransferase involved in cell wall biosynthesis
MHILLVADGRSPTTLSWISTLKLLGYHISLVSTFPCAQIDGVELAAVLPVAFSRFSGSQAGTNKPASLRKNLTARFRPLLTSVRYALGPWTVPYYRRKLGAVITDLQPDLVHAMRIPYEGMLAAVTPKGIPLVLSTWGNDLTLHAAANRSLGKLTRQAMGRGDALFSDTQRDVELAKQWGFDPAKPALVVVGNGGLDLDAIKETAKTIRRAEPVQIINPRGFRPSSVRIDTFFQAIPLVLKEHPEARFVCASMAGQKEALDWVEKLDIAKNVELLPFLSRGEIWQQFARSLISVSISDHDGTPNTLLEAMAFGCLPVCGDIASIREWITPGVNGALVSTSDPAAVAAAILKVLKDPGAYQNWIDFNHKLVEERANRQKLPGIIDGFYKKVCK